MQKLASEGATMVIVTHEIAFEEIAFAREVADRVIFMRDGHVVVPDGPGLGMRVNEASIRANDRVLAER